MDIDRGNQEGSAPLEDGINNQSMADLPIDYTELAGNEAFLGEMPLDTILEGLEAQFDDYINCEDKTNYVDIFYEQFNKSMQALEDDEEEEHPQEMRDALDKVLERFTQFMRKEFNERLTITITCLEDEEPGNDDCEFIFRRLYEFFILGAKNNFKTVIEQDVIKRIPPELSDDEWFKKLQSLMLLYSPLLSGVKPDEFLRYRGDEEIIELFEEGQVTGNFLRKYSPKFYQNDEFQVEVINYITMCSQFGKEIANA